MCESDPWAQPTALVVDLGLRKIERIVPFDVAAAHVVSDGVTDDLPPTGNHESKLRFGDVPCRVLSNSEQAEMSAAAVRGSFEKNLRSWSGINAIVATRCRFTLFHPGLL